MNQIMCFTVASHDVSKLRVFHKPNFKPRVRCNLLKIKFSIFDNVAINYDEDDKLLYFIFAGVKFFSNLHCLQEISSNENPTILLAYFLVLQSLQFSC